MGNSGPGFKKYPGYSVQQEPLAGELVIELDEQLICRTRQAIQVLETKHRPALYVPRDAFAEGMLKASDTQTYCPFKGTASYHSVEAAGRVSDDVFWYYPEPFDEVVFISSYLGVYQDRVSTITLDGSPFSF